MAELRVPHRSEWSIQLGNHSGQTSPYRGAADFYNASGGGQAQRLGDMAKGLEGLGANLFAMGIKDRQERQQISLLEDVQQFRRASDEFMTNFMTENQGGNAGSALEAYKAWSDENFNPLREKWAQVGPDTEKYFMQHGGSIVTGGLDSMMAYQRGETEKWYESAVNGEMARVGELAARPDVSDEAFGQAWGEVKELAFARARRKGLSPEAAIVEIDNQFTAFNRMRDSSLFEALLKSDPAAAEALLIEKTQMPEGGSFRAPEAIKPYMGIIGEASATYGVPESIILGVAKTESSFRPDAVSPTGVKGLMQVTQKTYDALGFRGDRADPRNSINAGSKLLSELFAKYGNWNDALADYNGGPQAVIGLRTGNWGNIGPEKQKEIQRYAPTVMKSIRENGRLSNWNTLFGAEKVEAMRQHVNQAKRDKLVNDYTGDMVTAYRVGTDADIVAARAKALDEINAMNIDPKEKTAMANAFERNAVFQQTVRDSADNAALNAFDEQAAQNKLSPQQRLEALSEVEGISAKAKVEKEVAIRAGTDNKVTRESLKNQATIRAMIDKGVDDNGNPIDEVYLGALNMQGMQTADMAKENLKYLRNGGRAGELQQKDIDRIWKIVSPGKDISPEAYNFVNHMLPAGGQINDRVIQEILAMGIMSGEFIENWGIDDDEIALKAFADKDFGNWLPDVTDAERREIRIKIAAENPDNPSFQNPSDEMIREYKKYQVMGFPLPSN